MWRGSLIGDSETKLAIYKCLKDVSAHFKEEHLNFIVDKIIDFDEFLISGMDLYEFHDFRNSGVEKLNFNDFRYY